MNKSKNDGVNEGRKEDDMPTPDASRGPDKAKKGYLFGSGTKNMIKGKHAILTHRYPGPALLCTPSYQSVV